MDHCIVFGAPRSGTTYLQTALSYLRGTETVAGMLAPVGIFHRFGQEISAQEERLLAGILPRGIDTYLAGTYNSRFRALEDWVRTPPQWRKLYHVLRQGRRPRPDWFVYKEPFISLAPRYVLEAIPEAKIIYIYRDGRDEEFIQSPPYVRAIWMWAYMAQRCREYFSGLDASVRSAQVLEIQYETFMQVPHETGERICEHLDTDRTRAFDRHLDAARTSSIGKHGQRPEADRQAAEDLAGSVLTTLGYPLTVSPNSRAQRTDA